MPGHKDDLVCFYFKEDKVMFVGDFIFENSIRRTDLDGGDPLEMKKSLIKILTYEEDFTIYPGHGVQTSLNKERENLKYFALNI